MSSVGVTQVGAHLMLVPYMWAQTSAVRWGTPNTTGFMVYVSWCMGVRFMEYWCWFVNWY